MSDVGVILPQQVEGTNRQQDRGIILVGMGSNSWALGTTTLVWAAARIYIPGVGYNTVNTGNTATMADGDALYVILNRATSGAVVAVVEATMATVPTGDDVFVLCVRAGNYIHFRDGTVYADTDSFPLGRGPDT